jgi:hypothetical protein
MNGGSQFYYASNKIMNGGSQFYYASNSLIHTPQPINFIKI